jgi:hypothetical protein
VRGRRRLVGLALVAAVLGACGGADLEADDGGVLDAGVADAPTVFIAFSSTFQGFRHWPAVHDPGPADDGSFPTDVLGPRTQYVNHWPPAGATEFPVGTVIVEARESGAKKIFAAVKRGRDFNRTGARNWEWFELAESPDRVLVVWRGVGPPTNDSYGGDPEGGCNSCHARCGAANDFICSSALQLSRF